MGSEHLEPGGECDYRESSLSPLAGAAVADISVLKSGSHERRGTPLLSALNQTPEAPCRNFSLTATLWKPAPFAISGILTWFDIIKICLSFSFSIIPNASYIN